MKFSSSVVVAAIAAAPMAAMAFLQPNIRSTSVGVSFSAFNQKAGNDQLLFRNNKAITALQMAFELKEGQTSNMFEGPSPLVKERDACGVGFIANTKTGGKIYIAQLKNVGTFS